MNIAEQNTNRNVTGKLANLVHRKEDSTPRRFHGRLNFLHNCVFQTLEPT